MKKTLLLAALASAGAFAQAPPPPPPPPPPQPMEVDLPRPPVEPAPREDPGGRIRWGVSGNLGWHIPSAFAFGAEGRVGYQFTNLFSAYGLLGGTTGVGLGWNAPGAPPSARVSGLGHFYVGAIGELIIADSFYLGGGLFGAAGGLAIVNGSAIPGGVETTAIGAGGFMPGVDLRLGFAFGRARGHSFRRGGFNIGLDLRMLFYPDAVVVRTRYDGSSVGAAVETKELTTTLIPMLMLGYDSR